MSYRDRQMREAVAKRIRCDQGDMCCATWMDEHEAAERDLVPIMTDHSQNIGDGRLRVIACAECD